MKKLVSLVLLLPLLTAATALAMPRIEVGNVELQPGTPDQQVEFYVTGEAGDLVDGLNFYIQVADGGPEAVEFGLANPPGVDGPHITAVDVVTGTIFAGDNDGQYGTVELPQLFDATIQTVSDTVLTDGLLATVTFDTTEWGPESIGMSWPLMMTDLGFGTFGTGFAGPGPPEWFGEIPTDVVNGTITIVPEPSTLALLVLGGVGLVFWRLRRRGQQARA